MMKFLVLSDIHCRERVISWANDLAREHQVDGFLILGDITHFGPPSWADEFLSKLDRPSYAVPGNCDPLGTIEEIGKHATCLHGKKTMIGGRTFGGWGGANLTIFNTPFEMPEEEILNGLRPIMEPDMVLLTHCPPYSFNDFTTTRRHAGSTAIRSLVSEFRPAAVISGHVHENRGVVEENGILYMNPGAAKNNFSALLEVGDGVRGTLLDPVPDH
jgi:Icc-related predicted phosphoesterase